MKLGVTRKLGLGMTIVMSFWLLVAWVAFEQIRAFEARFTAIAQNEEPAKAASYEMKINVVGIGFAALAYLDNRDPQNLERITKDTGDFEHFLASYLRLADTEKERVATGKLQVRFARFKALAHELVALEDQRISLEQTFAGHVEEVESLVHEAHAALARSGGAALAQQNALLKMDNVLHYLAPLVERSRRSPAQAQAVPLIEDGRLRAIQSSLHRYARVQTSAQRRQQPAKLAALLAETVQLGARLQKLDKEVKQPRLLLVRLANELDDMLDNEIQTLTRQDLERARAAAQSDAQRSRYVLLLGLLAALVSGAAVSLVAAGIIARPVSRLLEAMDRIGRGGLLHQISLRSKDELPLLARSLNNMVARLRETLVSRDYMSSILLSLTEGLFVLGEDGRVRTVNDAACKLTGLAESELLGMPFAALFPAMAPAAGLGYDTLTDPVRKETYLRARNGTMILVSLSFNRLRDVNGPNIGVVCVAENITLRKKTEGRLVDLSRRLRQANKRFAKELREREWLQRRILDITEEEKQRVGQELHDGLGQEMTGIAFRGKVLEDKLKQLGLTEADEAARMVQMLNESIGRMGAIARGLHPPGLEELGLAPALARLSEDIKELYEVDCQFHCQELPQLPQAVVNHLYRIAQEALNNAIKHGRATEIAVCGSVRRGTLRLAIADNGVGFEMKKINGHAGLGLRGMRFRAASIGAKIGIRSHRGAGYNVYVFLPFGSAATALRRTAASLPRPAGTDGGEPAMLRPTDDNED